MENYGGVLMTKYFTPNETMEILKIKKSKYYQLINSNQLSYFETPDGRRFHSEDQLEKYFTFKEVGDKQ